MRRDDLQRYIDNKHPGKPFRYLKPVVSETSWKESVNKNHECPSSNSLSSVFNSNTRRFENFKFFLTGNYILVL